MRTFYFFKIKKEFYSLTKDNPYNLYKSLENIYYLNKRDYKVAYNMFESIVEPLDKFIINKEIFNSYSNDDRYIKVIDRHTLNDYFLNESFLIIVNISHILLRTNDVDLNIFKVLNNSNNYFVCDFNEKDYFYTNEIINKTLVN